MQNNTAIVLRLGHQYVGVAVLGPIHTIGLIWARTNTSTSRSSRRRRRTGLDGATPVAIGISVGDLGTRLFDGVTPAVGRTDQAHFHKCASNSGGQRRPTIANRNCRDRSREFSDLCPTAVADSAHGFTRCASCLPQVPVAGRGGAVPMAAFDLDRER